MRGQRDHRAAWRICGIPARNAVDELNRLMQVRAAALKRFGENKYFAKARRWRRWRMRSYQFTCCPVSGRGGQQICRRNGLHIRAAWGWRMATQIVAAAEQRRALAAVVGDIETGKFDAAGIAAENNSAASTGLRTRTGTF